MRASNPLTPRSAAYVKQAIKTGIAGIACVSAARALRLPEGYWAAISAIIVMQSSVGATMGTSWNRLVGTAIGAAVGGLSFSLGGTNVLTFGLAVIVAILLCDALGFAESQRFAGVTVAIVMLLGHVGPAWKIALFRFVEVSLGIVIGMLVAVLVWPLRARAQLRAGIAEALADLDALFLAVLQRYRGEQAAEIHELRSHLDAIFLRNEGLQKEAAREPAVGPERRELLALLMGHLRSFFEAIDAVEIATRESTGDTFRRKLEPELGRLVSDISGAFKGLAEAVTSGVAAAQWFELSREVSALEEKVAEIRKTGATTQYSLDEILRFYSFLLVLKNLARELDFAHATITRLLPRAGGRP